MAIPQFDLPFRIINGQESLNEQGSDEDIATNVFAVCASTPGQFLDLPEFGLPDLVGEITPLSPAAILRPIAAWEPLAPALVEVNPNLFDSAVQDANIQVRVGH